MLTIDQAKKVLSDVAINLQLKRDDYLLLEGSINLLYAGAKENEESKQAKKEAD